MLKKSDLGVSQSNFYPSKLIKDSQKLLGESIILLNGKSNLQYKRTAWNKEKRTLRLLSQFEVFTEYKKPFLALLPLLK